MGHKVNPIGLRLGINRTWDSRWFAGAVQLLAQMAAQLQVLVQHRGVVGVGVPPAVPGAVDAEPQPDRIDLVTHPMRPPARRLRRAR